MFHNLEIATKSILALRYPSLAHRYSHSGLALRTEPNIGSISC